ncbi:MAG: hypothetical protein Q8Q31_01905 [Nanoarchaeota archaeon]|nr:hypothetical protein [Nanoarchaeota archaeon]
MVISAILSSCSASAGKINLEAPSHININENFSVTVTYDSQEILDIKITVQDKESKVYSEVYEEGWKSSFYYLQEKFRSKSTYLLRANKEGEDLDICVRLRKGEKVLQDQICKNISLLIGRRSIPVNAPPELDETIKDEGLSSNYSTLDNYREIINITLNRKIKNKDLDEATSYTSQQERINQGILASFPFVLLMILSFLLYKHLSKI